MCANRACSVEGFCSSFQGEASGKDDCGWVREWKIKKKWRAGEGSYFRVKIKAKEKSTHAVLLLFFHDHFVSKIFSLPTPTPAHQQAHTGLRLFRAFSFEWKFDGKYASISGERRRLTIAGRDDRRQRRDERIFIHKLGDFTQSESHNLTISITFLNRTVERFRAEYQLKVQNIVHDVNRRGFTFLSRLSALFWFCCVATRDSACTNTRKDVRSSGTFRTSLCFLIYPKWSSFMSFGFRM